MMPLSYLSDEALDAYLSVALRVARRLGCGYDDMGIFWLGPSMPAAIYNLLSEYKDRWTAPKR